MSDEYGVQASDVSLRDYLDLLRRRKAIIIQTTLVVFIVGMVITLMAKPVFRTSTRVLVEGKALTLTQYDSTNPLSNLFMPDSGHDVSTQIEILQGDALLSEAYRAARVAPGTVKIQVKQVGNTDVLEITADSRTAQDAQRLAEQLPKTFSNYVQGNHENEIDRALKSADDRYQEESRQLHAAEDQLEAFRARHHIGSLEKQRDEQIAQAGRAADEIRKAQGEVNGLEAQLAALVVARKRQPLTKTTPTTTSNIAIKQALHDRIASLQTEREGLLILYKPTHVKVQEVDAQIKEIRAELARTPPTITTTTEVPNPALEEYDKRIGETRAVVAQKKAELARISSVPSGRGLEEYGRLEVEEERLKRVAEEKKTTVGNLAKSRDDLSIRSKATHSPVSVIAGAGRAEQISPQRAANLMLSAVLGLVLGFCLALLQEYLDDRVNAPEDARRLLGAPVLSYVPLVESEERRLLCKAQGGGSLLESYRVMRTNVQFAAVDSPTNSIVVTSTSPGEGKSVTASNLAVAMALDGRRVIIVDADLRRPTLHTKHGVDQRPGLTNVLVGHTALEDALKDTGIPGLRILTAGPLPPNPAELLNSRAMGQVHERLKEIADVVIFDSPPFLATADAQVLAAEADGVIYVVQFGEARKSAVRHAVDLLQQARAHVLGVVFNKIDLTSRRDDYYYGYYRYYDYYHNPQIGDGSESRPRRTREFEAMLSNGGSSASNGGAAVVPAETSETEERE